MNKSILFHANKFTLTNEGFFVEVQQELNTNKLYLKYFKKSSGKEVTQIKPSNKNQILKLIKKVELKAKKQNLIIWSY